MLQIISTIAAIGLLFAFVDKVIMKPKPVPVVRNTTRYEEYHIDAHGTIIYSKGRDVL